MGLSLLKLGNPRQTGISWSFCWFGFFSRQDQRVERGDWPTRKSQAWDTWDLFWGRAGLWLPVDAYLLSCDLLSRWAAKGKVLCLHLCPYFSGTSLHPLQIPVEAQDSGTFGASGKWILSKPRDLFYWTHQDHGSPPKLGHGLSRLTAFCLEAFVLHPGKPLG